MEFTDGTTHLRVWKVDTLPIDEPMCHKSLLNPNHSLAIGIEIFDKALVSRNYIVVIKIPKQLEPSEGNHCFLNIS